MSDVLLSAIITVGGMLGVGVIAAIVQVKVTTRVVEAAIHQIIAEARVRSCEARRDRLHVALAKVVGLTDPEAFRRQPDPSTLAQAVVEAQLLLDLRRPLEGAVNSALNRMATELVGWSSESADLGVLFQLHGALIESSQRLIAAMDTPMFRLPEKKESA